MQVVINIYIVNGIDQVVTDFPLARKSDSAGV